MNWRGVFVLRFSFPTISEHHISISAFDGVCAMANRQQRGNREPKKPKKDKSKIAPPSTSSVWDAVYNAHISHGPAAKK